MVYEKKKKDHCCSGSWKIPILRSKSGKSQGDLKMLNLYKLHLKYFSIHLQIECSGIVDHAQKIIDANNLGKGMFWRLHSYMT